MGELDTGYIAPSAISEIDDDAVHERMLANLPDDIDKTNGGFAYDFTRPAALEKAELLVAINDAIMAAFPAWSYGKYLDMLAAQVALTRKQATYSETTLTVTGAAGTVIPAGFLWSTPATPIEPSVEFETLQDTTIDANGDASVSVRCTVAGTIGDVSAGSITMMSVPMAEISSVTNASAATGGTDTESDDDLRARIQEADLNPPSFTGCDADYVRWAKEVNGVGDVIVEGQQHGGVYHEGSDVFVYIMDSNGDPATDTLKTEVYNHIISPNDPMKRLAPIGAVVGVYTCEALTINISVASVNVSNSSKTASDIAALYKARLGDYMKRAKRDGRVRYHALMALFMDTDYVEDFQGSFSVNSGSSDVVIQSSKYPKIGTITITLAGS